MKKCFVFVLALVLLCALSGCGAEPRVAVFWPENPASEALRTALEDRMGEMNYTSCDMSALSPQELETKIREALSSGANMIALCEPRADALEYAIAAAGEAPLVIFGTDGEDYPLSAAPGNVCFIGFDSIDGGKVLGDTIGRYVLENFASLDKNGDYVITYAMLRGDETSWDTAYLCKYGVESADTVLTDGNQNALSYYDPTTPYKYLSDPTNTGSHLFGYDTTARLLRETGDIELILSTGDTLALGAADALADAGVAIPVCGFGGSEEALSRLAVTVIRDYETLAWAVDTCLRQIGNGKDMADILETIGEKAAFFKATDNLLYIRHALPAA